MPVCKHCGSHNIGENAHCVACGRELATSQPTMALESVTAPVTDSLSSQPLTLAGLASHNAGLQGLGGWLSLFFIGIVILGPVLNLRDALTSHDKFSLVFCLLFAGYEVFIGILIAKYSPKALTHLRIYFVICIVLGLINIAFASLNSSEASRASYAGGSVLAIGFRDIIAAVIWALYFRISKRVFNTFGRNL
jgi:hypothetical protein